MFGLGPMELVILAIVLVLLFGRKLPSLARSAGSAIVSWKQGIKETELELAEIEKKVKEVSNS